MAARHQCRTPRTTFLMTSVQFFQNSIRNAKPYAPTSKASKAIEFQFLTGRTQKVAGTFCRQVLSSTVNELKLGDLISAYFI